MVILPFNERKATEAAARLLKLRGGRMSYLKLIKLLYLVDRDALLRWGEPVTTDRYFSMKYGPVVSRIYSLINEGAPPGVESVWERYISKPSDREVQLLEEPPQSELSPAEEALIDEVFSTFGKMNRWNLVEHSHGFPEWKDPQDSALPIETSNILQAGGKTEEEIGEIEGELRELSAIDPLTVH